MAGYWLEILCCAGIIYGIPFILLIGSSFPAHSTCLEYSAYLLGPLILIFSDIPQDGSLGAVFVVLVACTLRGGILLFLTGVYRVNGGRYGILITVIGQVILTMMGFLIIHQV